MTPFSPAIAGEAIDSLPILLLEDCAGDAASILQELGAAGFQVEATVVSSRQEFLDALSSNQFSAVLSAYQLPGWDGVQALQELRRTGDRTPFILVTGVLGEEAAVECVKRGADDYVLKNHLARLPMVLRRALQEKALRDSAGDISRCAEENLQASLIEHSVYGVFRASLDGTFQTANSVLLTILACPSFRALQSRKLADVFRFPEHCAKVLASCRDNSAVHRLETEWRRRDGGFVSVKLHLRHLGFPGVTSPQLEGMVEDVTEIRALEQQLRMAQKFETIGQLARGVAHDFNNIIGAIVGWTELGFEESRGHPKIAERFTRIRAQADRAAALTRELLAIGHRQTLQAQSVDLDLVIRNLTTFLSKVIDSDIEIKLVAHELRPVHADASQIEQVLINICLNARDAMPQGGRLVIESEIVNLDEMYCRLHHEVSPGLYAVISIADTGCGMPAQVRDRIFEPFFTTKEHGIGSGMGLATAYGIVKQHGGFIHVYSEVGHGSLFRVYLPVISEATSSSAPQPVAFLSAVRPEGTETVLLAEDHDPIRESVRQSLTALGYRVLSAANGEEALHLVHEETPAIAILDLIMPRLGGAATASELRNHFPNLPILFASGYSEFHDSTGTRLPNSFYVQKPYSPTTLAHTIRRILDPPRAS